MEYPATGERRVLYETLRRGSRTWKEWLFVISQSFSRDELGRFSLESYLIGMLAFTKIKTEPGKYLGIHQQSNIGSRTNKLFIRVLPPSQLRRPRPRLRDLHRHLGRQVYLGVFSVLSTVNCPRPLFPIHNTHTIKPKPKHPALDVRGEQQCWRCSSGR